MNNWTEKETIVAFNLYCKTTVLAINNIADGKDRETTVKVRINEYFLRDTVLSLSNHTYCISGIGNVNGFKMCRYCFISNIK